MNHTLRILKIVQKEDYFTSCIICHHRLKKAFETNQGTMGWDCFCRQIGIPYVAKQKVLPKDVYENLAISIVDQLNGISIEEFGKQNLYFNFQDKAELEFPIRYISKINIRICPLNQGDNGQWKQLSIITRLGDVISKLLGLDSITSREVVGTKVFNDWFLSEQRFGQRNLPCGKTLQEMTA